MSKLTNYDANFTAGGLLFNEFIAIESLLLSPDFYILIKNEEEANEIIQISTNSARKRIIQELKRRYEQVDIIFWNHFFTWSEYDQKLALFYLILKTYPLIFDLHFEVALKKFKTSGILKDYDIQMRLDEIASSNANVANWSESTFKKINVQYRKTLKVAGLYDGNILIKPNQPQSEIWDYFRKVEESWFLKACFIEN